MKVKVSKRHFEKSVVKPKAEIVGGATTITFKAVKATRIPTEIEIERYGQNDEQKVKVTIKEQGK